MLNPDSSERYVNPLLKNAEKVENLQQACRGREKKKGKR